jgi:hypothetical protein
VKAVNEANAPRPSASGAFSHLDEHELLWHAAQVAFTQFCNNHIHSLEKPLTDRLLRETHLCNASRATEELEW